MAPRMLSRALFIAGTAGISAGLSQRTEFGNTVRGEKKGSWLAYPTRLGAGDAYRAEVELSAVSELDLSDGKLNPELIEKRNPHSYIFDATNPRFDFQDMNPDPELNTTGLWQYAVLGLGNQLWLQSFILNKDSSLVSRGRARQGDVLLRTVVEKWSFCKVEGCTLEVCRCMERTVGGRDGPFVGAWLDLEFTIKGYHLGAAVADGKLDIGGGVSFEPLALQLDGEEVPWAPSFPRVFGTEQRQKVFIARMPTFRNRVIFDAILHLGWSNENPPWTTQDYFQLFGVPMMFWLLICVGLYFLRPMPAKNNFMQKKLNEARRQRAKAACSKDGKTYQGKESHGLIVYDPPNCDGIFHKKGCPNAGLVTIHITKEEGKDPVVTCSTGPPALGPQGFEVRCSSPQAPDDGISNVKFIATVVKSQEALLVV